MTGPQKGSRWAFSQSRNFLSHVADAFCAHLKICRSFLCSSAETISALLEGLLGSEVQSTLLTPSYKDTEAAIIDYSHIEYSLSSLNNLL